jgi:hypothetical protein
MVRMIRKKLSNRVERIKIIKAYDLEWLDGLRICFSKVFNQAHLSLRLEM